MKIIISNKHKVFVTASINQSDDWGGDEKKWTVGILDYHNQKMDNEEVRTILDGFLRRETCDGEVYLDIMDGSLDLVEKFNDSNEEHNYGEEYRHVRIFYPYGSGEWETELYCSTSNRSCSYNGTGDPLPMSEETVNKVLNDTLAIDGGYTIEVTCEDTSRFYPFLDYVEEFGIMDDRNRYSSNARDWYDTFGSDYVEYCDEKGYREQEFDDIETKYS